MDVVRFVPNQSEKANYIPNLVYTTEIQKIFPRLKAPLQLNLHVGTIAHEALYPAQSMLTDFIKETTSISDMYSDIYVAIYPRD